MKDKDWEHWLTGRPGTLYGDMKRETMKPRVQPTTTFSPKKKTTNAIPGANHSSYPPKTKEDIHLSQENAIAGLLALGILALAVYGWFADTEPKTIEWYWYFGVSLGIAIAVSWLLRNWFRVILTVLRQAIKLLVYLTFAAGIIGLLYYIFST